MYIYIYIYIHIYLYIYVFIYLYIYIYTQWSQIELTKRDNEAFAMTTQVLLGWPSHDIAITNIVCCMAYKRGVEEPCNSVAIV